MKTKTASDDMIRERKSRGREELAALFDYLERTGSEQVQRTEEKETRKQKF